MNVIDFHTHFVPAAFPPPPPGVDEATWPVMQAVDDRSSRMVIGGRVYRTFPSYYWNATERTARMDQESVAVQVISPLPELLSYWLAPVAAEALTDHTNATIAAMVVAMPQRFVGFGSVVLQDLPCAIRQLDSFPRLGMRGVHVGSHVNGRSIADPAFLPFFESAQGLGLVVFVHGIKPAGAAPLLGPPQMAAVVGVPHETAMTISSFVMTDILGSFPDLKLVFAHGGGTLGAIIDRLQTVWSAREALRKALPTSPAEYLRRFHYDTAVFGVDYLAYLARKLGPSQLVAGTDGPADVGEPVAQFLRAAPLSAQEREQISSGNARRLLGL